MDPTQQQLAARLSPDATLTQTPTDGIFRASTGTGGLYKLTNGKLTFFDPTTLLTNAPSYGDYGAQSSAAYQLLKSQYGIDFTSLPQFNLADLSKYADANGHLGTLTGVTDFLGQPRATSQTTVLNGDQQNVAYQPGSPQYDASFATTPAAGQIPAQDLASFKAANPTLNFTQEDLAHYNQAGQSPSPAIQGATTLYDFYAAQGQALPPLRDRAALFGQAGGNPQLYTGTLEQNNQLLNYLKQTSSAQPQQSGALSADQYLAQGYREGDVVTQNGQQFRIMPDGTLQPVNAYTGNPVATNSPASLYTLNNGTTSVLNNSIPRPAVPSVKELMNSPGQFGIQTTPVNVNVPNTFSSSFLDAALGNPKSSAGIMEKIYADYQNLQNKQMSALDAAQQTVKEQQLQQALTDINNQINMQQISAKMGQTKIENQPIPMEAIIGQDKVLQQEALNRLDSLSSQKSNILTELGLEQDARKLRTEIAQQGVQNAQTDIDLQFKIQDAMESQINNYLDRVNSMSTSARQSLSMILNSLQGVTLDQLDANGQAEIVSLANAAGVPISLISQGLKVTQQQIQSKNMIDMLQAQKLYQDVNSPNATSRDTQVVSVGGRQLLVDTQTGQTIQDLGPVTQSPSGTTDKTYQDTQTIGNQVYRITYDTKGNIINKTLIGAAPTPTSQTANNSQFIQYIASTGSTKTKAELQQEAYSNGIDPNSSSVESAINQYAKPEPNILQKIGGWFGL